MMKSDFVSVIIPSYGRPGFLKKSINSICRQTYELIEIVVVDDNGRNQPLQLETERVINSIECRFPISYIIHETNQGGSAARNTGAKKAEGEFIALLDNDDECEPDRILKQVQFLKIRNGENPLIKACTCLVIRKKNGSEVDRQEPKDKENYLFDILALNSSLYTGSTLLIYNHTFFELEGFDEQFRRNQDIEFMVRFFEPYNICVLNEHLIILNIDDRTNIPSYQKIIETKKLFLKKYHPIISRFTVEEQHEIFRNNALQMAKVALWNKNIFGFIQGVRRAKLTRNEYITFFADIFKKSIMHLK